MMWAETSGPEDEDRTGTDRRPLQDDPADPPAAGADETRLRGVYIGADATNPTLILRIRSFLRAGAELSAFTFRRLKFNREFQPDWRNVHLGPTDDRRYLRRLPALGRALWIMLRRRELFRGADFIYARNIDLACLAILAKAMLRLDCRIVYEVEDVQAVFFERSLAGILFRRLEGWVLRRIDLLVVASPGFLRGYFEPVHAYRGPSYVLENRIQLGDRPAEATAAGEAWRGVRDRWVIGWFGTLRCSTSMAILEEIAERLGDRVEIYTRGYPTETGLESFLEIVDRHPNWIYDGEYTIPDDLEKMYGCVHFSWCLDFLDAQGNSPLLLACRMYQGGFYGAVPLVVKGWEMDRFLSGAAIGHAFEPPFAASIADFLTELDWSDYEAERARVLALRETLFLEDGRQTRGLIETIRRLAGEASS